MSLAPLVVPPADDLAPKAAAAVDRLAYSINETLAALPIGRTALYAAIAEGRLRTIKINGRRLVPRSALIALLEGGDDASAA